MKTIILFVVLMLGYPPGFAADLGGGEGLPDITITEGSIGVSDSNVNNDTLCVLKCWRTTLPGSGLTGQCHINPYCRGSTILSFQSPTWLPIFDYHVGPVTPNTGVAWQEVKISDPYYLGCIAFSQTCIQCSCPSTSK